MDQDDIEQPNAEIYERNNKRTRYKKRKLKTMDGKLILDKPDISQDHLKLRYLTNTPLLKNL